MKTSTKNIYNFGLGTVGRDMLYTLVSLYLIFYLTDILHTSDALLWWINGIMIFARVFDALNDPVMGLIVDNTRSRYGKFKPWIAVGALLTGIVTILLFTDFGLSGAGFVVAFGVIYLLWGITFTMNDISYWSMLPALSMDQKEREKIASFAKICANIGMFAVVVGLIPVSNLLGEKFGSMTRAYTVIAITIVIIMWLGQLFTLFGAHENRKEGQPSTSLKGLFQIILKNDQLLYIAIAMSLFQIGYVTTTSFGIYFFKYAYGDENMFSIFALILGVTQIGALAVFPVFSKRFDRRTLFTVSIGLILAGYVLFFFSPMSMFFIGPAGILLFLGEAFILVLMLMFLSDSVEYGQWKLGSRNESITLSVQPLINKMGGAIAGGIVGATVIVSGINNASSPSDVTSEGLFIMKMAMLILPLILIVVSYFIYRSKYKITEELYQTILTDLRSRGEAEK